MNRNLRSYYGLLAATLCLAAASPATATPAAADETGWAAIQQAIVAKIKAPRAGDAARCASSLFYGPDDYASNRTADFQVAVTACKANSPQVIACAKNLYFGNDDYSSNRTADFQEALNFCGKNSAQVIACAKNLYFGNGDYSSNRTDDFRQAVHACH